LLPEVVEAAVQTLKWATVPMFAMGTSLGGALSVHLCTQRDVAGIILCNPPSLPELLLGYNRWWNLMCGGRWLSQSVPLPLHTISSVQRISTPGVLITSLADQVVPPELQHRIAKNYAGPLKVIEVADADHRLRMADLPLAEIRPAVQWLLSQAGI
jgi:dienelactone hydrolase